MTTFCTHSLYGNGQTITLAVVGKGKHTLSLWQKENTDKYTRLRDDLSPLWESDEIIKVRVFGEPASWMITLNNDGEIAIWDCNL